MRTRSTLIHLLRGVLSVIRRQPAERDAGQSEVGGSREKAVPTRLGLGVPVAVRQK
jgi:hypothetical protein